MTGLSDLDIQMDEMLLEIKYLKSDEYVNGIKDDAIKEYKENNKIKCYWPNE